MQYKFGDRFRFLLEVGGGKTLSTEEFSSNSQVYTEILACFCVKVEILK